MGASPERSEAGFYDNPSVYDVLHTPGTAGEVDGLERIALRYGSSEVERAGAVWLEPACGTGRYLRVAAGRGCRVIGVDLSERMIAYARGRAERLGAADRSRYAVGDMERIEASAGGAARAWGGVDLAFCLINSVRHLASDAGMRRHLEGVGSLLKPGGVYAVGLSTSRAEWEGETEDVWDARRGGMSVRQVVQYLPPEDARGRVERVISHMRVERSGRGGVRVEAIDSVYELRTWRIEQWRRVVARAGLEVLATVDEMGDAVEAPVCGYAVWVLGRGG